MSFARIIIDSPRGLFECDCDRSRACARCTLVSWLGQKRALINSDHIQLDKKEWFEPDALSNGLRWKYVRTGKEIIASVTPALTIAVALKELGQAPFSGRSDAMVEHWEWLHK